MIVHGYDQLEIGKKYTRVVQGPDKNDYMMTFIVVREASINELVEFCKEMGLEYSPTKNTGPNIYEVSTD